MLICTDIAFAGLITRHQLLIEISAQTRVRWQSDFTEARAWIWGLTLQPIFGWPAQMLRTLENNCGHYIGRQLIKYLIPPQRSHLTTALGYIRIIYSQLHISIFIPLLVSVCSWINTKVLVYIRKIYTYTSLPLPYTISTIWYPFHTSMVIFQLYNRTIWHRHRFKQWHYLNMKLPWK